jgi:hypothetical protein
MVKNKNKKPILSETLMFFLTPRTNHFFYTGSPAAGMTGLGWVAGGKGKFFSTLAPLGAR